MEQQWRQQLPGSCGRLCRGGRRANRWMMVGELLLLLLL
jgi:hypothetical protein